MSPVCSGIISPCFPPAMMPEHTGLTQLSLCCQALLPPSDNASLPSVLSRSSAHDPALDAGSLLSIHSPLHTTSKSFPLICFRAHIPICDCYSLSGKESTCKCKRCRFNPWVGKIPWRRKWQPTPVSLPGESHGQRSLGDYIPWGRT